MSRLPLVPDKNRQFLSEEAALQFLEQLLLFRRKKKLKYEVLCKQIGISRMTLQRWRTRKRVPVSQVLRITSQLELAPYGILAGAMLSGPDDFLRALGRGMDLHGQHRESLRRQALGFATTWLYSRLDPATSAIELGLGSSENFTGRVQIFRGNKNQVIGHVDLAVAESLMVYQAYQHSVAGAATKLFEGIADACGLEMCLEFLQYLQQSGKGNSKVLDFDKQLRQEMSKHFTKI